MVQVDWRLLGRGLGRISFVPVGMELESDHFVHWCNAGASDDSRPNDFRSNDAGSDDFSAKHCSSHHC